MGLFVETVTVTKALVSLIPLMRELVWSLSIWNFIKYPAFVDSRVKLKAAFHFGGGRSIKGNGVKISDVPFVNVATNSSFENSSRPAGTN